MIISNAFIRMDQYFGHETKIPVSKNFSLIGWKIHSNLIITYQDSTRVFNLHAYYDNERDPNNDSAVMICLISAHVEDTSRFIQRVLAIVSALEDEID